MMTSRLFLVLAVVSGLSTATVSVASTALTQNSSPTSPPPAAAATPARVEEEPPPAIREFDLETLSRLGREIYRHDQLAWAATDVVVAKVGQARMTLEGCRGWVVDTSGAAPLVRFVRKSAAGGEAAYDVRFPEDADPVFEVPTDRKLTPRQSSAQAALLTAFAPFQAGKYPMCRVRGDYNFVVLDDPSGDGFLVYILRPKDNADSIPIGGHYRISVTRDGKAIKQVDRLSADCLTMTRSEPKGQGGEAVAIAMSHAVSPTPLETHVFLSLQEDLPFYVVTKDGRSWTVEKGKIKAQTENPAAQNTVGTAKP